MVEIEDLRPQYQQHYSSSSFDETPGRNVTQQRPIRPTQAHFDDYMSPEWPSTPGKFGAQYLADTPGGSRSGSPSLRSGQATPLDYLPPARNLSSLDSRPSTPTPTNQSHLSLTALLPQSHRQNPKDWVERDSIARLHDRDDAEIWGGWKRYLFKLVPILTFANTGIYLCYLGLRIACVLWAQDAQHTTDRKSVV